MNSVFLLTIGSGGDGDEWDVIGIYSTREGAERAKAIYESKKIRTVDDIEEWDIDQEPPVV